MTDYNSAQQRRPRGRSALATLRGILLTLLLLALAAASLGGLFVTTDYWRFELLAHFRWPFTALAAALALIALLGRHPRLTLLALLLLAINASMLVHHWVPPQSVAATAVSTPTVRALSINVYSGNRDIERVVDYIRSQSPDIVTLIEVTANWQQTLQDLRREYPYQAHQQWGPNQFGSVMLSRYPLSEPPRSYGYSGVGSLARFVDLPQGRCLVVTVHPIAPITERAWTWNAASLEDLGKYVAAARQHTPVLVMGDLNASPWGQPFKKLLADASLRPPDSKRIWWPTWRYISWPASIPIDHFLLSSGLQDTRSWVGPDIGSDHYPIGLDFAIVRRR